MVEHSLQSVAEKGIVGAAKEGATATIGLAGEAAKGAMDLTHQVDEQILGGGLSSLASVTVDAGRQVSKGVRELVPGADGDMAAARVVITSATFCKVNAVRSACQQTLGPCSVRAVPSPSDVALQPVGFGAGRRGAVNRIDAIATTGAEAPQPGEVRMRCASRCR